VSHIQFTLIDILSIIGRNYVFW